MSESIDRVLKEVPSLESGNKPDLQIKHTILLIDHILHIKILQKRGYSWVDIGQDYNLDVDSKCITNRGERIIFKWR